jgi:hypothetical protein
MVTMTARDQRQWSIREMRESGHPLVKLATLESLLSWFDRAGRARDQLGKPLTPEQVHDRVYEAIVGLLEMSPPEREAGPDRTQWMVAVVQAYRAGMVDQSRATCAASAVQPEDRNPMTEAELVALLNEWPPLMSDAEEFAKALGAGGNIQVTPEHISVRVNGGRPLRVIFLISDGRIAGIADAQYY